MKTLSESTSSEENKETKIVALNSALDAAEQISSFLTAKTDKSLILNDMKIFNDMKNISNMKILNNLAGWKEDWKPELTVRRERELNLSAREFCVTVRRGLVIHTSPSLLAFLHYPRDYWTGRNIWNFVEVKDRELFNLENRQIRKRSFYCRFRMYRGFKSGFAVKGKKKIFVSFKISPHEGGADSPGELQYLLLHLLTSPYSRPHEVTGRSAFRTKHTSDCTFSFLDENAVSYLGHFPHELEGTEIFDIIQPQDLGIVRDSLENVEIGKKCTSQPYRMKTRNGSAVTLVTHWSCQVNPYNKQQLEYFTGEHYIIEGPSNPDIFTDPSIEPVEEPIEDLLKIFSLKEAIKQIVRQKSEK